LEYGKKKLVAIWGNQGYVFKIDGTELGNFELEDGTPSGAMMMKNGKLGVIYQQDLILYSLDGFRYGSIMGPELSEGFESWDVAVDNEGRLWALTDTGWLYKFKKPGKKVFEWHFTETPVSLPRIDVHDGRVFLSQGNSIQVIDALEEMARLEAAAEAGE
jgi:outer membrane protein assembly factor BamB